jgi:hypothetical protein
MMSTLLDIEAVDGAAGQEGIDLNAGSAPALGKISAG